VPCARCPRPEGARAKRRCAVRPRAIARVVEELRAYEYGERSGVYVKAGLALRVLKMAFEAADRFAAAFSFGLFAF
jgi:hypothetical protein